MPVRRSLDEPVIRHAKTVHHRKATSLHPSLGLRRGRLGKSRTSTRNTTWKICQAQHRRKHSRGRWRRHLGTTNPPTIHPQCQQATPPFFHPWLGVKIRVFAKNVSDVRTHRFFRITPHPTGLSEMKKAPPLRLFLQYYLVKEKK